MSQSSVSSAKESNDNDDLFTPDVEDGKNESSEMLQKIKAVIAEKNKYPFQPCTQRTIVLVGRTRTGKSTVRMVLESPDYIPEMASLYSETRDISFNRIAARQSIENQVFYMNIVDTPGLFDSRIDSGEKLTNENIKKRVYQCVTRDVTQINIFAFVFNTGGGINNEDIESMIFVKENYPEMKDYFILLLTYCEENSETECKKLVEAFFQHPKVKEHNLKEFFSLGEFFMGCLRPQLAKYPDEKATKFQLQKVVKMREKLLDFILSRKDAFNIHYTEPPFEEITADGSDAVQQQIPVGEDSSQYSKQGRHNQRRPGADRSKCNIL